MLKFYYNPAYKYTNRAIIDLTNDNSFRQIDYANIDTPDTINGHIIYTLNAGENIPTYIVDTETNRRYFVSGITPLSARKKYQISLIRDIISESPNTWKQEQAYITAGTATNYNKYKRWNLPYTNTKISQQRLNFGGDSSFFVFYVNEQHINSNVLSEDDLQIKSSSIPGIAGYDYTVTDLSEIPNYNLVGAGNMTNWTKLRAKVKLGVKDPGNSIYSSTYRATYEVDRIAGDSTDINLMTQGTSASNQFIWIDTFYYSLLGNTNNCQTSMNTAIDNYIATKKATYGTIISDANYNTLEAYVDKIIYNSTDNKVYSIRKNETYQVFNEATTDSSLQTAMRNINWATTGDNYYVTRNGSLSGSSANWIVWASERKVVSYTLEELGTATSFDFNFIANVRKLPKSAVRCVNIVPDANHTKEEITQCLMLAQTNGINPDNTTGRILDIQYLPFSIATTTDSNLKINNTDLTAQFLDLDDYSFTTDLTDLVNINKETDTIKVVSPSRSSQFLFRPYDNNGNMLFHTKITLKPYTSVIYIRPSTQGLLMNDWDDKDCLIIEEDFSLTNVSSEWANYIYQNRNYQNAFERQIQGREFERTWERRVEQAQAKSDEWNARNISAQKAQTYTGNMPIISGIAGAIGTAWQDSNYLQAAKLDREYNEALYQESVNLSQELFSYQLDNIKSQPNIPSKITTIDYKFLDGVYLEFYSTNETELNAIENFYKYNGNRIDDYGTFATYWGNFVRGKIIISRNYTQPEINELNRRLSAGIFTGGVI